MPTSPRLKKARQVRSNVKTMLIVFFDVRGIVHREFVPPGQTVNQEFYLEVLRRLRENVWRKCPELWRSGNWFLHHDNAAAHTALSVTRYSASLGWTVVPHPPYSPDLAPCDCFLFLTMKQRWKERDLPPWRRWKQLRRRHSTTSSFSSSRDASHSGEKRASAVSYMPGRIKLRFRNPASGRHKHHYYLGQNGVCACVCTCMHRGVAITDITCNDWCSSRIAITNLILHMQWVDWVKM